MNSEDVVDFGFVGQDPSDLPAGFGGVFDAMPVFMGIFAVIFVAAVIFSIFIWVRNYNAAKKAGLDPFTLQTELAVRAANSKLLAPEQNSPGQYVPQKSIEQKLAELDRLLAKGTITAEEHKTARLKLLSE
ncbi:hypothetical protein CQ018_11125 [Arthrobacter sp. MYb227]|nr:hypothetical protein CQ018_11125 [Arthrobacter sp. MYb227]